MGYSALTFLYGNELGNAYPPDFSHYKKSRRSLDDFLYIKGNKLNGFVDFDDTMKKRHLIFRVENSNGIHIFEFEEDGGAHEIPLKNLVYVERYEKGTWISVNKKLKGKIVMNFADYNNNDLKSFFYKKNSFEAQNETNNDVEEFLKLLNEGGTMYSKEGYYFFERNAPISTISDELIIYCAQIRCLNVVNSTRKQVIEAIKDSNLRDLKCNQKTLKKTIGSQTYERKTKKRKSSKKTTKKRKSSKKTTKKKKSSKKTKKRKNSRSRSKK